MEGQQCPWGVEKYLNSSFLLSLDATFGAGDFFWSSLLINAITKGNRRVVLISAKHGPEHWESLLKKYSLDLRKRNLLDRLTIKYFVIDKNIVSQTEKRRASESCFQSEHCSWEDLQQWQAQGMPLSECNSSGVEEEEGLALFVDDLNSYEALSPQPRDARMQFNGFLYALRKTHQLLSLVAYGPSNACIALDGFQSNEPSLTEICKTMANITVSVLPLTSGYSQDVHGVVHITAMPVNVNSNQANTMTKTKKSRDHNSGGHGLRVLEESYTFKTVSPGIVNSHLLIGSSFK